MKPKSKKYLIEETIKRTGLDELTTNAILSFYWQHIRDFMQNPHSTGIFLNKLGTFSLSSYFVDRYIEEKESYITRMDKKVAEEKPMTKWQTDYYIRCQKDLVWLRERRDDLKQKKLKSKSKKAIRDEYIQNNPQQVIHNMEKQETNTKSILEIALQRWGDREDS